MICSLHIDGSPVELIEVLSKLSDIAENAAPAKVEPKKVKTEKPKAEAPKAAELEKAEPEKPERISMEAIRKLCAEKSKSVEDGKALVKAAIKDCGADSLADVDAERYAELFDKINAL